MATQYYVSILKDSSSFDQTTANLHNGTSSTAADNYEFRMGNGTYLPDRHQALLALETIKRYIQQNGLNGLGANLPLPTGAG